MKTNIRFLFVFLTVTVAQALAFGGTNTPKISFDSVPITEPYIAITFEDGPSSMLTPQVLKILADRNVKATFFVVGESAASHPDILKQEFAAGHTIGSRSWTHSIFSSGSDDQLFSDLQRTDQAIRTAIGNSPQLFSPFDASFTDVQCDTVNKQFGYTMIYWSVDSLALKDKGAAAMASSIVAQTKPGSIIMSSDINAASVAALPLVIDTLISKGYKFVTVPELIALGSGKKPRTTTTRVTRTTGSSSSTSTSSSSSSSSTSSPAPVTTSPSGFHPFGTQSPDSGSGPAVPDPNAPNAGQ